MDVAQVRIQVSQGDALVGDEHVEHGGEGGVRVRGEAVEGDPCHDE